MNNFLYYVLTYVNTIVTLSLFCVKWQAWRGKFMKKGNFRVFPSFRFKAEPSLWCVRRQ